MRLVMAYSLLVLAACGDIGTGGHRSPDMEKQKPPAETSIVRRTDPTQLAPSMTTSSMVVSKMNDGSETLAALIPWSLWTFGSAVWNGYVDFRADGVYWTHWGFGRYSVDGNVIFMKNDYDPFTHTFIVAKDGTYTGTRSDGVVVNGRILSIYHGIHRRE